MVKSKSVDKLDVSRLPLPPQELARYVGHRSDDDPLAAYEAAGRRLSGFLHSVLPDEWSLEGKRLLDFGCGSGRVLRYLGVEAEHTELHGCDIDEQSVQWLKENLCPPVAEVFLSFPQPPLPKPDEHYDLIYAFSVFTHLTDQWSDWILELHRLLSRDGLLVVSFAGRALSEKVSRIPWDEDRIGMNVLQMGQGWERGGPMVLHSRWWITAHWGRAFELTRFEHEASTGIGQGVVVMQKRQVELTVEDLEREEPQEPRELTAKRQQLLQLQAEREELEERLSRANGRAEEMHRRLVAAKLA
jgi:SAM-dependent methyltransferase